MTIATAAEIYDQLRKMMPNLPEASLVETCTLRLKAGAPPLISVTMAPEASPSDQAIGFVTYEIVRRFPVDDKKPEGS